jgi:hypothetical protein
MADGTECGEDELIRMSNERGKYGLPTLPVLAWPGKNQVYPCNAGQNKSNLPE